jgi:hypothetical protein
VGRPYLAGDRIARPVTVSRSLWTTEGRLDGVVIATVNLNDFSEISSRASSTEKDYQVKTLGPSKKYFHKYNFM